MERGAVDEFAALRWQVEIGADEAIAGAPVDRLARAMTQPASSRDVPPAAVPVAAPAAASARAPAPRPASPALPAVPAARRAEEIAAAAATREELRAALAAFDGCPLAATATNLVFSDGNPDSGLMFVGEGPGAEEDRAGLPFVGPSGKLLDRMLASIGLDRTRFLITNLIPWRPPGNRNPSDAEVAICLPFLLRHIALVRPRRLVLLGALATQAVTGSKAGIRSLRGSWRNVAIPGLENPLPALPMLHPAYLLRTPGAKREAWADLTLLRRTLDRDAAS
jgi:uracil-DNA glycosylase